MTYRRIELKLLRIFILFRHLDCRLSQIQQLTYRHKKHGVIQIRTGT